MKQPREEPQHRFMGFPVSSYPISVGRTRDSQPEAAGQDGALAHPLAWLRWRLAVLRGGPYVPGFAEYRRRHRPGSPPPAD